MTQEEAARLLEVCAHTFRLHMNRYEDDGLSGLMDRRLSQQSHRRATVDEVMRVAERYRSRHRGWSAKYFY